MRKASRVWDPPAWPIWSGGRKSGTPAYFYDLDGLDDAANRIEATFETQRHVAAYAVKANSARAISRTILAAGVGADVVVGAELELALAFSAMAR
jgi:diaminopimelate decarboxylase